MHISWILKNVVKTHIFLQNFVLIQPRTSPPTICKILLIFLILLILTGYLPSDRFGDASGPDCESVIDSRTGLFLCVPTSPKAVGPFPATSDDEGPPRLSRD